MKDVGKVSHHLIAVFTVIFLILSMIQEQEFFSAGLAEPLEKERYNENYRKHVSDYDR
jgi:hypothetical protein